MSGWLAGWLENLASGSKHGCISVMQFVTADEQEVEAEAEAEPRGKRDKRSKTKKKKEENTGNSACVSKTCKRGWSFGRSRANRGEACYQDNWCYPATAMVTESGVHITAFTAEGNSDLDFCAS